MVGSWLALLVGSPVAACPGSVSMHAHSMTRTTLATQYD